MVRARWAFGRVVPLVPLAALAGCSVVLPSNHPILCEIGSDGADPCLPLRMRCIDGECRPVCIEQEICNRVDDDCDGQVDEAIDDDGDHHEGCRPGSPDCNDMDALVHPDVAETCNGKDDDCDGVIDDPPEGGPPLCRDGQACIPRRGGCVEPRCDDPESPRCSEGFVCDSMTGRCIRGNDCTVSPDFCPTGQRCDAITRRCVTPAELGEPCATDYECRSGVCYPAREALGLAMGTTAVRNGICGQACCSDDDCPAGFVCWTPGTGARSCVRREILVEGGGVPDREACADDRACDRDACVLGEARNYRRRIGGSWCVRTSVQQSRPVCDENSDCRSGVCNKVFWGFGYCASACRTSADCARVADAYNGAWWENWGTRISLRCAYGRLEGSSDWFPVCLPTDGMDRPAGDRCSSHPECLDDGCILGRCRPVCCANSDCPYGQQCRPYPIGGRWQMHCGTIDDNLPSTGMPSSM